MRSGMIHLGQFVPKEYVDNVVEDVKSSCRPKHRGTIGEAKFEVFPERTKSIEFSPQRLQRKVINAVESQSTLF